MCVCDGLGRSEMAFLDGQGYVCGCMTCILKLEVRLAVLEGVLEAIFVIFFYFLFSCIFVYLSFYTKNRGICDSIYISPLVCILMLFSFHIRVSEMVCDI